MEKVVAAMEVLHGMNKTRAVTIHWTIGLPGIDWVSIQASLINSEEFLRLDQYYKRMK